MFSRLAYTLRETLAGFQRNVTLTVAAIITAAISLLIFGLFDILDGGDSLSDNSLHTAAAASQSDRHAWAYVDLKTVRDAGAGAPTPIREQHH